LINYDLFHDVQYLNITTSTKFLQDIIHQ